MLITTFFFFFTPFENIYHVACLRDGPLGKKVSCEKYQSSIK